MMDPTGLDLARLPLVRRMLEDRAVTIVERSVHEDWAYNRLAPSVKGWNPWSGSVYVAARSAMHDWRAHPERSLRDLNEGDLLLPEVLFAVHDYLHVWSARFIAEQAPEHAFGHGPITKDNAETLVFLSLLTEAAATAGVDYWYLSTIDLNAVLPIGTTRRNLTVSYCEEDLEEHRRAFPALAVQDPKFFTWLCRLYTTGVAGGFANDSLRRSPRTQKWLEKELKYGQLQREYARSWLQHLSGSTLFPSRSALSAPSEAWQHDLVRELGLALWQLVKEDRAEPTFTSTNHPWTAPNVGPFDPRFENLAALVDPRATLRERGLASGTFRYLFAQAIGALDFEQCGERLKPSLAALEASASIELLFEVVQHYPKVVRGDAGPHDMFFMS